MVKGMNNRLRRFYIGGLPFKVDCKELRKSITAYLSQWGDVVHLELESVKRGKKHKLSKGYGFFMYRTKKQADNFMNYRPHYFRNRKICLKRGVCKGIYETPGILNPIKTIFIAGLRPITTVSDLRKTFKHDEEKIEDLGILKYKDTGSATGFGFVTFTDEDCVDKLVLTSDFIEIKGYKCMLKKKLSKEELKKLKADSEMEVIRGCIKKSSPKIKVQTPKEFNFHNFNLGNTQVEPKTGPLVMYCKPTCYQPYIFQPFILHPNQSGSGNHGESYWGSNLTRLGQNVFGRQGHGQRYSGNAPGFDGYGNTGYSVDNGYDGHGQWYDVNNNDIYGREYGHVWFGNYDSHGQDYVRDNYTYEGRSYVGGVSGSYCNSYGGYGYVRPRYGAGRYFEGYAGQSMRGASTSSSWHSRQSNSGQVCSIFTSKPQPKPIKPEVKVKPIKPADYKVKPDEPKVEVQYPDVKVHESKVCSTVTISKDDSKVKFNGCKVAPGNNGQSHSDAWPGTSHSSCSSFHEIKLIQPNVNLHGVLTKFGDISAKVHESKVKVHESKVKVHEPKVKVHESKVKIHESKVKVHESKVRGPKVKVHKPKVKFSAQFHDDDRTRAVCKIFPTRKVKVGQPTAGLGDPNIKVGDCGQGRSEDGPRQAQSSSWSELGRRNFSGTMLKFHGWKVRPVEAKVNLSDRSFVGRDQQANAGDGTKGTQSNRFSELDGQKVKVVETKEPTAKRTMLKSHSFLKIPKVRPFEPEVGGGCSVVSREQQVNMEDGTRTTQSNRFTKRKVKIEVDVDGFGQSCSGEPEAKRKVKSETKNNGFPVCGRNYGEDCKKNRNQPTKRSFEPKVKIKTEVDDGFHGFEQDCGTSGSKQTNNRCSSQEIVKVKTEVNDEFVGFGSF